MIRQSILKIFGILFLASGLWILSHTFLKPESEFILSVKLAGIDIGGILYGIINLAAGYNILRLNPSGRILGIVVVFPYLIIFSYLDIVMPILIFSGEARALPYIRFPTTRYGMDNDYIITTSPFIATGIYFFMTLLIVLFMWLLISRKTKDLFDNTKRLEIQ